MSERILIPLPGLGTLELPREVFDHHLLKPSMPTSKSPSKLVDAAQLEERTGSLPAGGSLRRVSGACRSERLGDTFDLMSMRFFAVRSSAGK